MLGAAAAIIRGTACPAVTADDAEEGTSRQTNKVRLGAVAATSSGAASTNEAEGGTRRRFPGTARAAVPARGTVPAIEEGPPWHSSS